MTYEIGDESIIVVRTDETAVKAYYNVCQHRGRRLTEGCGNAKNFYCRFHGWRWNLDGSPREVLDRNDYGELLQDPDITLKMLHVDCWAGFIFVTMVESPQSPREYLAPVPEVFDNFEFEKMRYRWYKSVVLPCNWKVALEAFNEGYHVAATHPQLLRFMDDWTISESFGKHAMFTYPPDNRPLGFPSRRLGGEVPDDLRQGLFDFVKTMEANLRAIYSSRDVEAAKRLLTDVPSGEAPETVMMQLMLFQREAAVEDGAGWPDGLTPETLVRAGSIGTSFRISLSCPTRTGGCGTGRGRTAPTQTRASSTSGHWSVSPRARSHHSNGSSSPTGEITMIGEAFCRKTFSTSVRSKKE